MFRAGMVKILLQHNPPESGHGATRLACPFRVKSGHYTAADHCLGRSRGGLTTKIHAVVDAQGLPIRLGLTTGQAHDGQIANTLLNQLGPHTIVLADKAYDADRIRQLIQDQGATPDRKSTRLNSSHLGISYAV